MWLQHLNMYRRLPILRIMLIKSNLAVQTDGWFHTERREKRCLRLVEMIILLYSQLTVARAVLNATEPPGLSRGNHARLVHQ